MLKWGIVLIILIVTAINAVGAFHGAAKVAPRMAAQTVSCNDIMNQIR